VLALIPCTAALIGVWIGRRDRLARAP